MRVLMLTSSISAAEARWMETIRRHGHELEIFDAARQQWIDRGADHPLRRIPGWLDALALRRAGNAVATFYGELLAGDRYDAVLSAGLAAGGAAGRHSPRAWHPLLFTGDLDFSAARTLATQDFADLTRAAEALYLENHYEYDKALSKDSRSAHLRIPAVHATGEGAILAPAGEAPAQVVLLHPEGMPAERVAAFGKLLSPALERTGGELTAQSVSSVFRHRDAARGRKLAPTMRTRLGAFSHAVLVGSSRDHVPVLETLLESGAQGRVLTEDTIAMELWSDGEHDDLLGRGSRLASLLEASLDGSRSSRTHPRPGGGPQETDPLAHLDVAARMVRSRDEEELDVRSGSGPLNVFFSTTPLEDSAAGARPQRIRNMEKALRARGDYVRIPSSATGYRRRAHLVDQLLADGRGASLFYGENSTSPMPLDSTRDGLAALVGRLRTAGGVSGWFVRDLHWLDPAGAEAIDDPARHQELVERGLEELLVLGSAVDVLYAPSQPSVAGFKRLLEGHRQPRTPWEELPPGIAPENVVDSTETDPSGRTTLLYAGGLGSFYTMTSYLAAVRALDGDQFAFDFVVREAEVHRLNELLAAEGLTDDPRITVLTDDLGLYRPRPGRTIGTVLLDSEYAKLAFPYKTVSFLEKGFPILTFRDMGLAGFVEEAGVGEVCDRDVDSIVAAVERMTARDYVGAITAARVEHSWSARLEAAARTASQHADQAALGRSLD